MEGSCCVIGNIGFRDPDIGSNPIGAGMSAHTADRELWACSSEDRAGGLHPLGRRCESVHAYSKMTQDEVRVYVNFRFTRNWHYDTLQSIVKDVEDRLKKGFNNFRMMGVTQEEIPKKPKFVVTQI